MGLRQRAFIALTLTVAILVFGIYKVTDHFLARSYASIEEDMLVRNADRFRDGYLASVNTLISRGKDYANWDDMYAYVDRPTKAFVESNLVASTLKNINVDFLAIIRTDGTFIDALQLDSTGTKTVSLNQSVKDAIQNISSERLIPTKASTGLVSIHERPYLITVQAVQPSEGSKPVHGFFAIGYELTPRQINALSSVTHLEGSIRLIHPDSNQKSDLAKRPTAEIGDTQITFFDHDRAECRRVLNDLYGAKTFEIITRSNREIHSQYIHAARWLLIVALLIGCICITTTVLLVDSLFLKRILILTRESKDIAESGEDSARLSILGHDELTNLAKTMNQMLDTLNEQKLKLSDSNKRLTESEDRYQLVISGSQAGIYDWDLANDEIGFTKKVLEILDWPESEERFPVDLLRKVIHEEDIDDCRSTIDRHVRNREPYSLEFRIDDRQGEQKWIHATGQVVYNENDEPCRIVGSVTDITSRKMAEAELMRFFLLVEHSDDFIAMATLDGKVFYVNPSGCQKVGLGSFFENHHTQVSDYYINEEQERVVNEILPDVFQNQKWEGEIEFRNHSSGDTILMHEVIFSVPDPATGLPACYGTVARDITLERKTTAELAIARDAALESSRTKAMFLANMSHEIRTPMNGIIGMTELLLETKLDSDQRDYAKIVKSSAESLLSIINDILDFSKIEAGKLQIENIEFNLRDVLEEAVRLLSANAFGKGLELACRIPPDMNMSFIGDPMRIRQVVLNLLGNAIKFTQTGSVLLETKLEMSQEEPIVVISVTDTGIGIADDRQQHVFDSFTQADGSSSRKYGGSGLGLTISKQITELMGGSIHLESTIGVGSVFSIRLPLEMRDSVYSYILPSEQCEGRTILVVDDNDTNRLILHEYLKAWKFDVQQCVSGVEAVDLLQNDSEFTPSAILLDMQMPEMDGLETAAQIRSIERLVSVPMIIVTSAGRQYSPGELAEAGISALLHKPILQSQLLDLLMSVIFNEHSEVNRAIHETRNKDIPLRGLRFLLVEDNVVNQKVAVKILEKMGCKVDVAGNGRIAVEKLAESSYDMVLMDCQMPEMDGYTATRTIREKEANTDRHQPIIAMTAGAMEGDKEKCLDSGMDAYVSKPVRPNELLDVIRPWLHLASSSVAECYESSSDFDPSRLMEACAGDVKFMQEIATEFCFAATDQLKQMAQAIGDHDSVTLQRIAHTLKGASRTIGGIALASICEELEICARNNVEAGLEGIIERAHTAYLHLSYALQRLSTSIAA